MALLDMVPLAARPTVARAVEPLGELARRLPRSRRRAAVEA